MNSILHIYDKLYSFSNGHGFIFERELDSQLSKKSLVSLI